MAPRRADPPPRARSGLGTDLLLSDATRQRLASEAGLDALPAVRVKGKSVEVSVFRAG